MAKHKVKKGQEHYRQGDVLFFEVDSIPEGLKKTKKTTLAYGEKTGHHHSFDMGSGVVGYADDEEGLSQYFEVEKTAALKHQEHDPIVVGEKSKKFAAVIQVEYTPQEIRQVMD